jgi:hypothetical protein
VLVKARELSRRKPCWCFAYMHAATSSEKSVRGYYSNKVVVELSSSCCRVVVAFVDASAYLQVLE